MTRWQHFKNIIGKCANPGCWRPMVMFQFGECPLCQIDKFLLTTAKLLEDDFRNVRQERDNWRRWAKDCFEPLWTCGGEFSREEAHRRLARAMRLHPREVDLDKFTTEQNRQVVQIIYNRGL